MQGLHFLLPCQSALITRSLFLSSSSHFLSQAYTSLSLSCNHQVTQLTSQSALCTRPHCFLSLSRHYAVTLVEVPVAVSYIGWLCSTAALPESMERMLGYSLEDLRLQLELGEASQVAWHSAKCLGSLLWQGVSWEQESLTGSFRNACALCIMSVRTVSEGWAFITWQTPRPIRDLRGGSAYFAGLNWDRTARK